MIVRLNSGHSMPMIGFGTWKVKPPLLEPALLSALQSGCRHIDGASVYENESALGDCLARQNICSRSELFITSKLWNTKHAQVEVVEACKASLKAWGLEYFDLYLIHWPFSFESKPDGNSKLDASGKPIERPIALKETWRGMEELVSLGLVLSIGVSNFSKILLKDLLATAKILPAVNQVEMHPYLPQTDLLQFCQSQGIAIVAYSPLGMGSDHSGDEGGSPVPVLLKDPIISSIAARVQKSPAQVLLGWLLGQGVAVIPRSTNPARIAENVAARPLGSKLIGEISSQINLRHRYCDPLKWWGRACFNDEDA